MYIVYEVNMNKFLLIIVFISAGWLILNKTGEVSIGPGVFAADMPVQNNLDSPKQFQKGEYTITELASFEIKAKILGKKNYFTGRESDLSPVDLALGWGRMSDESVLEHFDITQSGRWYRWKTDAFPIPRREVESSSANMHMIPADSSVKDRIQSTKKGQIIQLRGSLVKVSADDGWYWRSSLTRNDTGDGACEIIWVTDFQIITP